MQLTSKFDLIWLKQEDMIFFRCLIKHYAIKVYGRFGVYLHLFWIFELDVSGQIYAPAALFPVKEPLVPLPQEAGWVPAPVWTLWRRENLSRCFEHGNES